MFEGNVLQEAKLHQLDNFLPPENFRSFFFTTKDKTKIRVAIWNEQSKKGTIVLQSGRGEFIEKYYEVVEDLIKLDFCVAMFDWRGQGLSDRLTSNHYVGYVKSFEDYENDLLEILDKVYGELPKPCIGMGHSMGGCLMALTCSNNPGLFDKLILCAPMLSLRIPNGLKRLVLLVGSISPDNFKRKALPNPTGKGNEGWEQANFEDNVVTTDKNRYERATSLIYKNKELAIGPVSIAWSYEAIRITNNMRKKDFPNTIDIPVLLLNATKDKLVNPAINKEICQKMTNSTVVDIDSEHEILMEKDTYRNQALKAIEQFIN
tara:strand:+ start:1308 stop:2264 length:957 start_codon:yes stop_codon:yes gene_type:complete